VKLIGFKCPHMSTTSVKSWLETVNRCCFHDVPWQTVQCWMILWLKEFFHWSRSLDDNWKSFSEQSWHYLQQRNVRCTTCDVWHTAYYRL